MKDNFKKGLVLYFVDGFAPTRSELQAASKIDATVEFRNIQIIPSGAPVEKCVGVAGKVPVAYSEVYPVLDAPKPARKIDPPKSEASE